jgi:hypothetical protein
MYYLLLIYRCWSSVCILALYLFSELIMKIECFVVLLVICFIQNVLH